MQLEYPKNVQLTKNFNINEFNCKDGTLVPYYYVNNVMYVAIQLQKIHDLFQLDWLRINSGYRTESHNKKVGGAKNSYHLYGRAADISQQCLTVNTFYNLIMEAVKLGFIPDGEILKYNTFVHYAPQFDVKHYEYNEERFQSLINKNKTFVKKCRTHNYTPF